MKSLQEIVSLVKQGKFQEALSKVNTCFPKAGESASLRAQLFFQKYLALRGLHSDEDAKLVKSDTVKAYDTAINSVTTNEDKADLKVEKSKVCMNLSLLRTPEPEIHWALDIYKGLDNQEARRKGMRACLNLFARVYFMRSEYDQAIEYLKEYEKLLDKDKEDQRATYLAMRARILMKKGELRLAEENLLYAIEIYGIIGNQTNILKEKRAWCETQLCKSWIELGYIYSLQRKLKEAEEFLNQAHKIIETWSEKTVDSIHTESVYYEFSGFLAYIQGNYPKAHECYQKVFDINEKVIPMDDMISQTKRFLAELLVAENDYDNALKACDEGYRAAFEIEEKLEIGAIHRVWGQIYTAIGQKRKARDHFEESISFLSSIKANSELAFTYLECGKSEAFDDFERNDYSVKAREMFDKIGIVPCRNSASKLLRSLSKSELAPISPGKSKFHVFLAYNTEDEQAVKALGEELKRRRLKPWFDKWNLPPGRPFQEGIEHVLPLSKSVAVFIGPSGIGPWEDREMRFAISQFVRRKLPVIPVLLPGVKKTPELPPFLQEFSWVRFSDSIKDPEALDRLEWGITGKRPQRKDQRDSRNRKVITQPEKPPVSIS